MGKTKCHYDTSNQFVREDNMWLGKTFVWTYDDAGNITSCKEYAYINNWEEVTGTPTKTNTYTYGDTDWGDLLTAYDGVPITYDTIGNPLNDGTWTYTWRNGRELASMTSGNANEYNLTMCRWDLRPPAHFLSSRPYFCIEFCRKGLYMLIGIQTKW